MLTVSVSNPVDRYTSSYIGRPGAIHERDYDTGFCSEDEPDEHEQWRPIRLDGTDFHSPPKNVDSQFPEEISRGLKNYPTTRAHTLSSFNAHAALAVIINRVRSIRSVRVHQSESDHVLPVSLDHFEYLRHSYQGARAKQRELAELARSIARVLVPRIAITSRVQPGLVQGPRSSCD